MNSNSRLLLETKDALKLNTQASNNKNIPMREGIATALRKWEGDNGGQIDVFGDLHEK